ncbi:MAG: hypothetical protein ACJAWC_002045 [Yoonia sp.]|jgi:hypothetical protein
MGILIIDMGRTMPQDGHEGADVAGRVQLLSIFLDDLLAEDRITASIAAKT